MEYALDDKKNLPRLQSLGELKERVVNNAIIRGKRILWSGVWKFFMLTWKWLQIHIRQPSSPKLISKFSINICK